MECPKFPCTASNIKVAVNKCNSRCKPSNTYETIRLKPNFCCKINSLTQEMLYKENAKYVIEYDFSLLGQTITVPKNCILEFDGGTLSNGTIIGQDTYINDVGGLGVDVLFGEGITRKGTWRMNEGGGSFEQVQSDWNQSDSTKPDYIKNKPTIPSGGGDEDKPYDPDAHSGLGRKTLELGEDGSNILTQEDFDRENTIYVIKYDFDLGGETIQMPAGCVLDMDGGSFANGRVASTDTILTGAFNKSVDNLFGVFYDNNKNTLGWDKNKIEDWKISTKYGNITNSIEPGEYFGYNQSIVADTNYIYLLFSDNYNQDDLVLGRVSVLVYDRNYNYIGYSLLDRPCHANGATIYNNKIYIACCGYSLDNETIHIVDISSLLANCRYNKGKSRSNARTTVVEVMRLGFIISSIDYDSITDTFCLGCGDPAYYIYDTSFNLIKQTNIGDYRNYGLEKFGRLTTVQDFVYQNGVIYAFDWDFHLEQDTLSTLGVVYTIDVSTDKVIDAQPVSYDIGFAEPEGVCKDPVTGEILASCNNHSVYRYGSVFTVCSLTYNNTLVGNANQYINKDYWINKGDVNVVFVDNSVTNTGVSRGTKKYPFKTLSEALVLAGSVGGRCEFHIVYSGIPYYVGTHSLSDITMRLYGATLGPNNEYPEIDCALLFRGCKINVDRLTFKQNYPHGYSDACLYFEQHCTIDINKVNFILNDNSVAQRCIIVNHNNYMSLIDISLEDTKSSDNSRILIKGFSNTVNIHSARIVNGNIIGLGDFTADQSSDNKVIIYNVDNINLTGNALLVSSSLLIPEAVQIYRAVSTLEQLNKIKSMFVSPDGARTLNDFSLCLFICFTLTDNGCLIRPGWYTNKKKGDTVTICSISNPTNTDGIFGGPTDKLPTSGNLEGRYIYDTERHVPLWWDGAKWNDVTTLLMRARTINGGYNYILKSHNMRLGDGSYDVDTGLWQRTSSNNGVSEEIAVTDSRYKEIISGLKLTNSGSSSLVELRQTVKCHLTIGRTYTFSAFIKGHGKVRFTTNINNNFRGTDYLVIDTDEYKSFSASFTIPSGIDYGAVDTTGFYLILDGQNSEVNVYGVKLEEGIVATEWQPNSKDFPISSTTANRPTDAYIGYQYFDETLNKPIWYKGNNEWVDSNGTTV